MTVGRYEIESTIGFEDRIGYVLNPFDGQKQARIIDGKDAEVTVRIKLPRQSSVYAVNELIDALESIGLSR